MSWKFIAGLFTVLFIIFAVAGMFFYFLPFQTTEFIPKILENRNYNFSVSGDAGMQFYDNMRYPSKIISYRIDGCNLQKADDMKTAFDLLQSETNLSFHPVIMDEYISVTCDERVKIEENYFIAGEGGPTNITKTNNFNVILHGAILLLKNSDCERPNVALHELLHALGFDHSKNPNNVMYNISKCDQTLGDDIPNAINKLYSVPTYADLSFENASASMSGRYLDLNITIRNDGLQDAGKSKLIIYANNESVKEVDIDPIKIGEGLIISFKNIFVTQFNVNNLRISIDSNFYELDKSNNEINLEIKK